MLLINMRYLIVLSIMSIGLLTSCSKTGYNVQPFQIRDLQGKDFTEKHLENQLTVMVVWATWCRPCLQKIPTLNALKIKYPNSVYWALSDDAPDEIHAINSRIPFHWKLFPESEELTDQLQTRLVKTYPQFVVIENGKVIYEETTESADGVMRLDKFLEARNK
jgi:cytochrome c biogenesis protein CcmG/thiol:disulfide interchange protein DsbE